MFDAPVPWTWVAPYFAVLVPLVAGAGWLRGSRHGVVRVGGTLFLGVLMLISIVTSLAALQLRIFIGASCLDTVDDRVTGPAPWSSTPAFYWSRGWRA
jgi:hypothetical protein